MNYGRLAKYKILCIPILISQVLAIVVQVRSMYRREYTYV